MRLALNKDDLYPLILSQKSSIISAIMALVLFSMPNLTIAEDKKSEERSVELTGMGFGRWGS